MGHPIWVVALLLLVLNDHLLKGGGLLPGWLTGKLSDFAGLVVAPVLLAALVRAQSGRTRAAACALVGLGFAATKLFPGAAGAVERALAVAQVDWRLWSDPTDLIALVVLPLAWWVARRAPRPAPAVRAREHLLVMAGAMACLATSSYEPVIELELVNRTRAPIPIARFVSTGALDCTAIAAGNRELPGAAFASDGCLRLEPGMRTPLGRIEANEVAPLEAGHPSSCKVILLRAPGLADTVLAWRTTGPTLAADPASSDIYIEEAGDRRFIAGTAYVQAWTATFPLPPSACADVP